MSDITMRLAVQIRSALCPSVRLPLPDEEKIELSQDKQYVHLLAQRLGVPIPETWMLGAEESLQEVVRKIRYPAVIKPRFSRFLRDGRWVNGSVVFAHSPDELVSKYRGIAADIPSPIVQEKIEGEGRGVFLCRWKGTIQAVFCHRRLREKPPWGGVSVYSESVSPDGDLVEKASRLLEALNWNGVAMVEFKMDRRDGQAKLMEINGRFWGSLQLAIDAGMNFPHILYRLAVGEPVPAQMDYKSGVKCRWLLGDLDHLLIRFTHAKTFNGLQNQPASKVRACLNFLKFWEPGLHYEVLRLDDPGPGWQELKSYVAAALRTRGTRA